jgi:hypothetical protein
VGFAALLIEAVGSQPGELDERKSLGSSMAHWGVMIDGRVRQLRDQAHGMLDQASDIEDAWKKWDVDELVSLGAISRFQGKQLKAALDAQEALGLPLDGELLERAGRARTLTRDISSAKKGISMAKGTSVTLSWPTSTPWVTKITDGSGNTLSVRTVNLHKYVSGISKPPSERTQEKWYNDGYSKTVTGERVEPDSFGGDGAPSWLLAAGMI